MVWNTPFRFNGAQSHTHLDVPSVCEYRWLRPSACICTHAAFIIISCFICNTYFQILVALKSLYQQIEPLELPLIIYPAVNTLTTAWKTQIGRTVTTLTKFLDNMMSSSLGSVVQSTVISGKLTTHSALVENIFTITVVWVQIRCIRAR